MPENLLELHKVQILKLSFLTEAGLQFFATIVSILYMSIQYYLRPRLTYMIDLCLKLAKLAALIEIF